MKEIEALFKCSANMFLFHVVLPVTLVPFGKFIIHLFQYRLEPFPEVKDFRYMLSNSLSSLSSRAP